MTYYTEIGASLKDVASAAQVALRVTDDPALSTVVSLVQEIQALPSKGPASPSTERGIGLSKIVTPLRAFVAYKKNPWILPALAGGVVLTIFALGVMSGRRRRTA